MNKLKTIITVSLLFSINIPAFAYKVKTFQPLKIAPLETIQTEEPTLNENYPKITQLEINLFKRTFEKESIYNRLSRIENKIFKTEYPQMPLASRVDNIFANIDPGVMYNISARELARLETKILGRAYPNDDTESRITRLEKEMLGAMQGGKITERFETVKKASKHYNSYPEIAQSQSVYQTYSGPYSINNQYNNYRSRGGGGFMQNLLGILFGGMNTGTMTGFTPPIYDPYNPYAQTIPYSPMGAYPGFMNPAMGEQDYYTGNRHAHMNNRNIGSQSSVRILD